MSNPDFSASHENYGSLSKQARCESLSYFPTPSQETNKIYTSNFELDVSINSKAIDLKTEDLERLSHIDSASIKTCAKIIHRPTRTVMMRKIFYFTNSDAPTLKEVLRELKVLHKCQSPYIVDYYGSFVVGRSISNFTEYMDCGSLDLIHERKGPIPEPIVGKIAYAVVTALKYLHDSFGIIHTELKPGNILLNSKGEIKITDFSVSPRLDSWRTEKKSSNTLLVPELYLSPEQIKGDTITSKSDVWSLGLILMGLSLGQFPFKIDAAKEFYDFIIQGGPLLYANEFSPELQGFLQKCLVRDVDSRASLDELANDSFYRRWAEDPVDMVGFTKDLVIINY